MCVMEKQHKSHLTLVVGESGRDGAPRRVLIPFVQLWRMFWSFLQASLTRERSTRPSIHTDLQSQLLTCHWMVFK